MSDMSPMDDSGLPFLRPSPPVLLIPSTLAFALAAKHFPFLRSRVSRYGDDPLKKLWLFVCSYMLLLQCANVLATAWLHGSQSGRSPLLLSRPFSEGSAAAKLAFLSVIAITAISMSLSQIILARIVYLIDHRTSSFIIAIEAALFPAVVCGIFSYSSAAARPFKQTLDITISALMVAWTIMALSAYGPLGLSRLLSQRRGITMSRVFADVVETLSASWWPMIFIWNCASLVVHFNKHVEGREQLIWLAMLTFLENASVAFTFKLLRVYHDSTSKLPSILGRDNKQLADEIALL